MQNDLFTGELSPVPTPKDIFFTELHNNGEATCGCCQRRAKINPTKVHSTNARQLIKLYNLGGFNEYVHTKHYTPSTSGRDFCQLKHWRLIESMPNEDTKKRTSGMWKITEHGLNFVLGNIMIPKTAWIYDKELIEMSAEFTSIKECLGDKFNYSELINNTL